MNIPETIAALGFFGAIFVFPIVYVLLRHQRAMAELLHRNAGTDAHLRIEALEREVRELRAAQHEQIIREDDLKGLGQGGS